MDLKEFDSAKINRHPWETARLKALREILAPHLFNGIRILDAGCGDGFISRELFSHLQTKEITAVDINLSDDQILRFNSFSNEIKYMKEFPDKETFNLVLMLDLLEHVNDDLEFLADIDNRYLTKGDKLLITVPAFQSIYGRHDVKLGHYRRYSLHQLESIISSRTLKIISSGYLFATLLLPKYLLCTIMNIGGFSEGVGQWEGGRYLTRVIEKLLVLDNRLLILLARKGIRIPGLTGWALCEKQA